MPENEIPRIEERAKIATPGQTALFRSLPFNIFHGAIEGLLSQENIPRTALFGTAAACIAIPSAYCFLKSYGLKNDQRERESDVM